MRLALTSILHIHIVSGGQNPLNYPFQGKEEPVPEPKIRLLFLNFLKYSLNKYKSIINSIIYFTSS